jgi:hypothetical protein
MMAGSISERVAVFNQPFEEAKKPYALFRAQKRRLAGLDLIRRMSDESDQNAAVQQSDEIARTAFEIQDPISGPFDSWMAMQALRLSTHGRHEANLGIRRTILKNSMVRMDRIATGLDDGSSHIAFLDDNTVTLFPSPQSEALVYEKHRPTYRENSSGGSSMNNAAKRGVFAKYTQGISVRGYKMDKGIDRSEPVFVQTESRIAMLPTSVTTSPDPIWDPDGGFYSLPFVSLGSEERPRDPEELEDEFEADEHRYGLRAAAFLGGHAAWLTVERPSEGFRERIVVDLASQFAGLLRDDPSIASMIGPHYQRRLRYDVTRGNKTKTIEPIHFNFHHLRAINHGAGVSYDDIKEKTVELTQTSATTPFRLLQHQEAKRKIDDFFREIADTE